MRMLATGRTEKDLEKLGCTFRLGNSTTFFHLVEFIKAERSSETQGYGEYLSSPSVLIPH